MKKILVILVLIVACQPVKTPTSTITKYFEIREFLSELVIATAKHPRTTKVNSMVNGIKDTLLVNAPDSLFWAEKLGPFLNINLNKPGLIDAYEIANNRKDSTSNLLVTTYSLKNGYKSSVKKVKLKYLNQPEHLRYLLLELETNNPVYQSHQQLQLWLQGSNSNGVALLDSLHINGYTKTIFLDSMHYTTQVLSL